MLTRLIEAAPEGVVLDPFAPGSARAVRLPIDLAAYPAPMLALRRVEFLLDRNALAVTVCSAEGEEVSFEVDLDR